MPEEIVTAEFEALMQRARVLRGHFDKADRAAEMLMIGARRAGDWDRFDQVRDMRRGLYDAYAEAMELIADRLTTPDQLRATRRALEGTRKAAWDFVTRMEDARATLEEVSAVLALMTDLLGTLKEILD